MWSFKHVIISTIAVFFLVGCTFRPLYGNKTKDTLPAIDIRPIANREGQILRNHLVDRLPEHHKALYTLNITVQEISNASDIRKYSSTNLVTLLESAKLVLTEITTGKTLLSTSIPIGNSYNLNQVGYAAVATQSWARRQAMETLADEIVTRLMIYFEQQKAAP